MSLLRESLRKKRDFDELYSKGRKYVSGLVVLRVVHKDDDKIRLGLAVSKKVGKAVVRNRVKRVFREIFYLEAGKILPGTDLLLIARKGVEAAAFHEILSAVKELFHRARLYKDDPR